MKGHIIQWNDEKGYGFIMPNRCNTRVFFHISDVKKRTPRPQCHETVRFTLTKDKQDRPRAIHVERKPTGQLPILFMVGYFFLLFTLSTPNLLILMMYVIMSIVTACLFASDKKAATTKQHRIPESTLLLLTLLGGWPGALLAQRRLNHKTRKQPFKSLMWIMIGLNIVVFELLSASSLFQTAPSFFSDDVWQALTHLDVVDTLHRFTQTHFIH